MLAGTGSRRLGRHHLGPRTAARPGSFALNARAALVAESDGHGRTRLTALRSEAPLVLRPTPAGVYLAGGAAGPIGGDHVTLDVTVGTGASLTIRSVAAAVVLPGPGGQPSLAEVDVTVADGGSLRWLPEPVVAAANCRHQMRARVRLGANAQLTWRDEIVLGRHGEDGGAVVSSLAVEASGRPLVRHELAAARASATWQSGAVAGDARAAGSIVLVHPAWEEVPPAAAVGRGCAVLPLAGPGAMVTAVADDFAELRQRLTWGARIVTEASESWLKAASGCSSSQNIRVIEPQ